KELYLKEVNNYFQNNKYNILKNVLKNFDKLGENNNLNIYLDNISDRLDKYLIENNYINKFNENKMYFWDYNIGFNKI
ncbi:MAG: hypothetical protein ACOC3T_05365, partial [Bacteroidota bacterium]